MKKSIKTAMITAAILIGAGLLISTIGAATVGFDFSRIVQKNQGEKKTFTISNEFDSISIKNVSDNVEFLPSEGNECTVICYDHDHLKYNVSVNNGTLDIREEDNRQWFEHIGFFNIGWESENVTVYLPEGTYHDLNIDTVSGNVTLKNHYSFDNAVINTISGDISITKIKVNESDSFDTISGSVTLDSILCGTMTAESVSGDITLRNPMAKNYINLNTTSGDIQLNNPVSESLSAHTVSGDIVGIMSGSWEYDTSTISGDVDVPKRSGKNRCELRTTSGDITIKEK